MTKDGALLIEKEVEGEIKVEQVKDSYRGLKIVSSVKYLGFELSWNKADMVTFIKNKMFSHIKRIRTIVKTQTRETAWYMANCYGLSSMRYFCVPMVAAGYLRKSDLKQWEDTISRHSANVQMGISNITTACCLTVFNQVSEGIFASGVELRNRLP